MSKQRQKRPKWARGNASAPAANVPAAAERRARGIRVWTVVGLLALGVTALAVVAALTVGHAERASVPRAAILDQLAVTNPNAQLIQSTASMFHDAGYRVDYYAPDAIDVKLYERLPTLGYKIILVRSHSTGLVGTVNDRTGSVSTSGSLISLFTGEPYEVDQHVDEQRDRTLDVVRIAEAIPGVTAGPGVTSLVAPQIQRYFGITPAFIATHASGQFAGTVVLLMGCDAMSRPDMARAFRSKGATAVIGWDGPVTPEHTDQVTAAVLQALLANGLDANAAVDATMRQLGKDPVYGASLVSG